MAMISRPFCPSALLKLVTFETFPPKVVEVSQGSSIPERRWISISIMETRQGRFACLRAYDQNFAKFSVRIHAEFVLKEGFFTTWSMAGKLILNRATGEMVFLSYVSSTRFQSTST